MDPRLEQASLTGDLGLLHQLLHEDRLLLDRPNATLHPIDNPLHVAALLGHADFAREILNRKPELARDLNGHGLSSLHLASANGHLSVVKEILKRAGSGLCLIRDKDGLMPIHTAATRGRIHVLGELMITCPESTRAVTYRGETILHLAVKSNCFDAVKFLIEKMGDVDRFLDVKDDKGNTVLHLAVARRQFQTVKLLLAKPGIINVNSTNTKGLTSLDVLLELPTEHGDLELGELIRANGGKTAAEQATSRPRPPPPPPSLPSHLDNDLETPPKRPSDHEAYRNTPGTLMVVATLIATITFQAGLNPPGGFAQANGHLVLHQDGAPPTTGDKQLIAGEAVLGNNLTWFLMFDAIGLFASLSIILLLICVVPRRRRMVMGVLVWVMWIAVFFTALAFQCALTLIYTEDIVVGVLAQAWFGLLRIAIVWICIRFIMHLLRWVGWLKREGHGDSRVGTGVLLVLKRIVAVVAAAVVVVAVCYVNIKLERWIG